VAFCTDVSTIPADSREQLKNLDVLVLNTLRHKPHPTHLHLDAALNLIRQLQPRQAYLTHMSHELDYDELLKELPANVAPGIRRTADCRFNLIILLCEMMCAVPQVPWSVDSPVLSAEKGSHNDGRQL
jgi:hypothetical protein